MPSVFVLDWMKNIESAEPAVIDGSHMALLARAFKEAGRPEESNFNFFGRRFTCGMQQDRNHSCQYEVCGKWKYCGKTAVIKSIFDEPVPTEKTQRVRFEGWLLDGPNMVRMPPFVVRLPLLAGAREVDVCPPGIRRIPSFDLSAPWLQELRKTVDVAYDRRPEVVPTATGSFNFLELPLECRNKIYMHYQETEHPLRSRLVVSGPQHARRYSWRTRPHNILKTECYSLLCLTSRQVRKELIEMADVYPRTIVLEFVSGPHLLSQLSLFKLSAGRRAGVRNIVLKFNPRTDSPPWILSHPETIAFIRFCNRCPSLEAINIQYSCQVTASTRKKVLVDINCAGSGKKRLLRPSSPDLALLQWQATLYEEVGMGISWFKNISHGRGRGSMQCSHMLGRHSASWAVNEEHQLLLQSREAPEGPTVLFLEVPTANGDGSASTENPAAFTGQEHPPAGKKRKRTQRKRFRRR